MSFPQHSQANGSRPSRHLCLGRSCPQLAELGHEVDWSGNWPKDPGDHMILGIAHSQSRILITLDKDFGELAILKGMPHSGIIRLSGFRTSQMAGVINHLLLSYESDLTAGAIITASPERIRIRRP